MHGALPEGLREPKPAPPKTVKFARTGATLSMGALAVLAGLTVFGGRSKQIPPSDPSLTGSDKPTQSSLSNHSG